MGNNKPTGNIDRKIDSLTKSAHELSDIIIRFMEDPEVRDTLEVQHPGITPDGLRATVKADLEQIEKDAGNKTEHFQKLFQYVRRIDDIRQDAVRVRFPDVEYEPFMMAPNVDEKFEKTAAGGARYKNRKTKHRKSTHRKTRRRH